MATNTDDRWGKVLGHSNDKLTYTTAECRKIRNEFNRQNKGYKPGTWAPVTVSIGSPQRFVGRRSIDHHSTQTYLVQIEVIGGKQMARHYLITEKCSWKSAGVAVPTDDELAAWNTAYAAAS